MKKRILGVSFLQAVIIAATLFVYFQLGSANMQERVRGHPIIEPAPWYFNFSLFLGTFLLFQAGTFYFLAKKFLKTAKEVVIVSVLVFILLGLYPVLSTVPAIFKYMECRPVLLNERNAINHEAVGECFTFMENARAYVVIPMFFVYLAMMSGINISFGVFAIRRSDRYNNLN